MLGSNDNYSVKFVNAQGAGSTLRMLSNSEIKSASMDFKDCIGKGGFGVVYKGVFHGTDIAIKVLNDDQEVAVANCCFVHNYNNV